VNRTEQIFELPGLKGALDPAMDDEAKVFVKSGTEARPTSGKARSAMAESSPICREFIFTLLCVMMSLIDPPELEEASRKVSAPLTA
jgi:hypothetical protein